MTKSISFEALAACMLKGRTSTATNSPDYADVVIAFLMNPEWIGEVQQELDDRFAQGFDQEQAVTMVYVFFLQKTAKNDLSFKRLSDEDLGLILRNIPRSDLMLARMLNSSIGERLKRVMNTQSAALHRN